MTLVSAPSDSDAALNEDFSDSVGREADVRQIVFAQFGVQGPRAASGSEFIRAMRRMFSLGHGPRKVERCHHWDAAGCHEDILMAYWMDTDEYEKWLRRPEVASWWDEVDPGPGTRDRRS